MVLQQDLQSGEQHNHDAIGYDDYGYESKINEAIFAKLAGQYDALPEDERLKFKKKNVSSISDVKVCFRIMKYIEILGNILNSSLKFKQEK